MRSARKVRYPPHERFLYIEQKGFLSKTWVKYFTYLDLATKTLICYRDETKELALRTIEVGDCRFYDAVRRKNAPCCIKILTSGPHPTKYFIKSDDLNSIDQFKAELEGECEATFEGQAIRRPTCFDHAFSCCVPAETGDLTLIEMVEPREWSREDVFDWLRLLGFEDNVLSKFQEADVEGRILLELDARHLVSMGVPEDPARLIGYEIDRLNKNRTFSIHRHSVKKKIAALDPTIDVEDPYWAGMIDALSDRVRLKHRFLTTADLSAHTINVEDGEEQGQISVEQYNEAKIHVKLVVTEVSQVRNVGLKQLVSPVVSALIPSMGRNVGVLHSAIIVGPWYLEWSNQELVIPKRMVCGRAVISADVDTLMVQRDELSDLSDRLAEVVVRYNTLYRWRQGGRAQDKSEKNCQDFVDDVFSAMGITNAFDGALGEFLRRMRSSGQASLTFAPDRTFQQTFNITEEELVFQTHRQLDEFCLALVDIDLEVSNRFSSEWTLLKSFDRAFWLRHLKFPQEAFYAPLPAPANRSYKPWSTGCPFRDPRETMSYKAN